MDAKYLMVGDWIIFHDSGYASDGTTWEENRVCQIDGIDEDVRVKWYDESGCKEDCPHVSTVLLSPIPLTPENLEKIGFESQHNVGYVLEHYDDNTIIVDLWNHTLKILMNYKVVFEKEYFDTIPLHELQHALKLCGIEKEIEL